MSEPRKPWSEAEDRALKEFYPRHGTDWVGWDEVLPERSERAIECRAYRFGLMKPRKPSGPRKYKPREKANGSHYGARVQRTPDPYEGYVMECMAEGLTPTEIDAVKRWPRGTARMILSEMWLRDKEKHEHKEGASQQHGDGHR